MAKPDVLFESGTFYCCIVALATLELHLILGGVLPQHVSFQNVISNTFERTYWTGLVHFELFSILPLFVLYSQMLNEVGFLWSFKSTERAAVKVFLDMSLLVKLQTAFAFKGFAAFGAQLHFLRSLGVMGGQVLCVVSFYG